MVMDAVCFDDGNGNGQRFLARQCRVLLFDVDFGVAMIFLVVHQS